MTTRMMACVLIVVSYTRVSAMLSLIVVDGVTVSLHRTARRLAAKNVILNVLLEDDGVCMNYEAWRISFQDSEQAARAAFNQVQTLQHALATAERERDRVKTCLAESELKISDLTFKLAGAERELAELRREVEAARAELREKNGYILTDGR